MPTPSDPTNIPSKQFSSDTNGDPSALAAETRASAERFSELQKFLNNSLETPGSCATYPQNEEWESPHPSK